MLIQPLKNVRWRSASLSFLILTILAWPVACTSAPPPPTVERPDLSERMALATERALELFLDGEDATMGALTAFLPREPNVTTWTQLVEEWRSTATLGGQMDPRKNVMDSLAKDADWPKPPETVDDATMIRGFFDGVRSYLSENGR